MDNKVTMTSLAAMMALATGKQKKLCEDFLQEIFTLISDELGRGESVRIKGFGTFKLVDVEARKSVDVSTGEPNEIPPHKKIIFVACKELAGIVNSPFEAFEAEEISDDLTTEELSVISDISIPEVSERSKEEPEQAIEVSEEDSEATEELMERETTKEIEESDATEELEEEMLEAEIPDERRGRFGWGFLTGFLSALGVAAVAAILWWGFGDKTGIDDDDVDNTDNIALNHEVDPEIGVNTPVDSLSLRIADNIDGDEEVPTQPSDTPVLDTISTTRFLTTMAQDHYGNFNLWPIIYDENSKILGHPDRIKPGTQIVVPRLSKYGIDPHNAADINRMKERGKAIYSKYR